MNLGLLLFLASTSFADSTNLPAVISPCTLAATPAPPQAEQSLLLEVLARTDGFGSTYLSQSRIKDMTLTPDDIKFFKRLNPQRSRTHHFRFSDIEFEAAGSGSEPYVLRGKTGIRHYFNFQRKIDDSTFVIAQLNETTIGNKTSSYVLLGFADTRNGEKKWSQVKLGSSGTSSRSRLDLDNVEHFEGWNFGYASYKFITIHVPEEEQPGSKKWVPTGSGSFSIDFFRDVTGLVTAKLSGYAVRQ